MKVCRLHRDKKETYCGKKLSKSTWTIVWPLTTCEDCYLANSIGQPGKREMIPGRIESAEELQEVGRDIIFQNQGYRAYEKWLKENE